MSVTTAAGIWVVNSLFPSSTHQNFADDELAGREKINLKVFCLTLGTCLSAVTKIWILEPQHCPGRSSGAALTKDPLWVVSGSFANFLGAI